MGRGIGSYVRKGDRERLLSRTHCAYCKRPSPRLTIEHIVSIERGGDSARNNLTAACPRCNSLKQAYDMGEFLDRLFTKRDVLRLQVSKYCLRFKRLKKRKVIEPKHVSDMIQLKHHIRGSRNEHSYFTAIINSIINQSYYL